MNKVKAIQASISSCLKPIYEKEKEKVKTLSLEEQGQYNLEKSFIGIVISQNLCRSF